MDFPKLAHGVTPVDNERASDIWLPILTICALADKFYFRKLTEFSRKGFKKLYKMD